MCVLHVVKRFIIQILRKKMPLYLNYSQCSARFTITRAANHL